MDTIVFAMPGKQAAAIAACLPGQRGEAEIRHLREGES